MLDLIDMVLVLSCHHLRIDDKTSSSLYGFIYIDLEDAHATSCVLFIRAAASQQDMRPFAGSMYKHYSCTCNISCYMKLWSLIMILAVGSIVALTPVHLYS